MSDSIAHRDCYVRITGHNGKSHIRCHRVWNSELFLANLKNQGREAKKPEDRFTVTPATADEYRQELSKA